jgi:hypothetical protein
MSSSRSYHQKINEYFFILEPSINQKIIYGGIALFVVGIVIGGSAAIFLTLIGLVIASSQIFLYKSQQEKYNARPTDQQMDHWLMEDIKHILDKNSLEKLGLNKSDLVAKSVFIPGPLYWSINGVGYDIVRRKSNDKTHFKYSHYNIQIFHFTENYLVSRHL